MKRRGRGVGDGSEEEGKGELRGLRRKERAVLSKERGEKERGTEGKGGER